MTLSGRILQIDISGYKVAVGKVPVQKPQWREGSASRPAAVPAGSQTPTTVRIALDEASNVTPVGLLSGRLGPLSIQGPCRLITGEQDVASSLVGDPAGGFRVHSGDAEWSILPEGGPDPVALGNTTFLEIFELLGEPAPFFSKANGVWKEVLQFLANQVILPGVADPAEAVGQIARFCHQSHALRYDTQSGAPHFSTPSVQPLFKLSAYLQGGPPGLANCYDQTAAIQTFAGALGVGVKYRYLRPFGYLQVVDLLGVGPCNNPVFLDPTFPPQPIVPGTPRSFFDNHTFCELRGRIYDACVGPHVGVHPPGTYLDNVIDRTVQHVPGRPDQIVTWDGVSAVL